MQTAMCQLVVQTAYVQNDIFASNFLNNGPILIIFFCLKALDLFFQLHERLCNSTSARGAPRALVECYVQTAMCKLEPCANWYVQNDIFASNFLNNGPILINFFLFESS